MELIHNNLTLCYHVQLRKPLPAEIKNHIERTWDTKVIRSVNGYYPNEQFFVHIYHSDDRLTVLWDLLLSGYIIGENFA